MPIMVFWILVLFRMLLVKPQQVISDLEDCHQTVLSHVIDVSQVLQLILKLHSVKGSIYRFEEEAKKFLYEVLN